MKKIEAALAYYAQKEQEILDQVNKRSDITAEELVQFGEEMAILEYKMTALEVAKEN